MNHRGRPLPVGTKVIFDRREPAVILETWPTGSEFFLLPHYLIRLQGDGTLLTVTMDRVLKATWARQDRAKGRRPSGVFPR